jgi:hypothetical protein
MLHVVKQIQQRFPTHGARIVTVLLALSASALLLGIVLMLSW